MFLVRAYKLVGNNKGLVIGESLHSQVYDGADSLLNKRGIDTVDGAYASQAIWPFSPNPSLNKREMNHHLKHQANKKCDL